MSLRGRASDSVAISWSVSTTRTGDFALRGNVFLLLCSRADSSFNFASRLCLAAVEPAFFFSRASLFLASSTLACSRRASKVRFFSSSFSRS
jgi:hypothetical protein